VRRPKVAAFAAFPAWLLPHISKTDSRSTVAVRQPFSFLFFSNAAHWFFASFLGRPTP
jgi:hypothetical protein